MNTKNIQKTKTLKRSNNFMTEKPLDFSTIGTTIDSIDLAALLIALGFPLVSCNTVEGIRLDGGVAPKKTITWKFKDYSEDGKHKIDNVRQKWVLPKDFTLDVFQLSRLLAQNLGIIKNIAKRPETIVWNDFDGIGLLANKEKTVNNKVIPISTTGFGGVCDTATIALAITLGVVPNTMYVNNGRLYMTFLNNGNNVTVNDVHNMLKDPAMRDPNNKNAIAVLICQLDNRSEILANIDNMRKKIRLIGDDGETQVLFEKGKLTQKDKAKIEDLFG